MVEKLNNSINFVLYDKKVELETDISVSMESSLEEFHYLQLKM